MKKFDCTSIVLSDCRIHAAMKTHSHLKKKKKETKKKKKKKKKVTSYKNFLTSDGTFI